MDISAAATASPRRPPLAVVLTHDHSLLRLLHVVLVELGLEIYSDEIHSGTWQIVERLQPALVVVDVALGREYLAWELVVALKEHWSTRGIPVLACAAAGWLLEKQSPFLDRYSVHTWSQPFDLGELIRIMTSLLGHLPSESNSQPAT